VSDGSTDGTDDYLRSDPPLELVVATQENAGPAAARNTGINLATGSLLLFVDDDVIATPQLIEMHVASHRRNGDGLVVIGPMLTPRDVTLAPWVLWEQTMLYRQYDAMRRGDYPPTPRQFYTGNASVARAAVLAVGGFDSRYRRAEDIELAYRLEAAGLRFEFNHEAIGYHHADRSHASWLQNARDYGRTDVVLARDHGHAQVREIIRDGFHRRSAPARRLICSALDHPRVETAMRGVYRSAYAAGSALHSQQVTRRALSGIYGLAYYRGVADELGGADEFRRQMLACPARRA
jgi:GT2 family glycosyltransferase